ncbi:DUF625-domain-containing protein [Rickenella mellea]|uniref:DUF625-domain-containing protein n=1 Tax=Rickenella mellea TaxID=50990 RepID=A0A4R5XEU2_9AGAM|nr:DUF625-domain-containing protein [Rickenella mellea]
MSEASSSSSLPTNNITEHDQITPQPDAEQPNDAPVGDTHSSSDGDQDWSSDGPEVDMRRVKACKVYELIGSRWTDRGTAFCIGDFDEPNQEAKLIARSESNHNDVLLCCAIRPNDVYQRQQETLIVWTEPDGTDYALSFQDIEGCSEVWDFIVEVQRHLNTEEALSSSPVGARPSITTQQIIHSGRLPEPQMGIIGDIERAIRALARTAQSKERLCEYIQQEEYIKALLDVFHAAEEVENLDALHALCSCMQTILLLNDHAMYEHILSDELWVGVVGMMEYDPDFPAYKANYREFLIHSSRFLQPVTIQDPLIQRKIHQTYRLQYLKDVILARALDDSTFNVLNSCIIFNQIDIINHVQNDDRFLKDVVGLFVDPDVHPSNGNTRKGKEKEIQANKGSDSMDVDKPDGKVNGVQPGPSTATKSIHALPTDDEGTARRKAVIFLIQQLCVMGKNVQLPARIALFRSLVERGILYAVQWALCRKERNLVSTAGEILAVMLDHDTSGARQHVLKQDMVLKTEEASLAAGKEVLKASFDETLVQVLCKMLSSSHDLALQNQLADALRTLLDVPQLDLGADQHHGPGPKLMARAKDDPNTERFLDIFYKNSVDTLFKPIVNDVPERKDLAELTLNLSREKANLYLYLCDLLCSFTLQHSFRSHFYVLSSNIAARVASLLSVRDKHLCLAALRFFRICLRLNNRNISNHLMKYDIFSPVLDLAMRESRRDNLLSSTCQEYFEHMRKENMKEIIHHIMTKRESTVRQLAQSRLGSQTYQGLILRWEINNEPLPNEEETSQTNAKTGTRRWGDLRLPEAEEEDYFNTDDDDEELIGPLPAGVPATATLAKRRRLRITPRPGVSVRLTNGPPPRSVSPLSSLLDYDEDDDTPIPVGTARSPGGFLRDDGEASPFSPVFAPRTIQIPPSTQEPEPPEPSDPEDDLLEALVTNGKPGASSPTTPIPRPATPGPSSKPTPTLSMPPMRTREKRRRQEEEEDDELLERLASKSKRPSLGSPSKGLGAGAQQTEGLGKAESAKNSDEGPKKLKLKLAVTSRVVSSSSPANSRNNTKDGDEG